MKFIEILQSLKFTEISVIHTEIINLDNFDLQGHLQGDLQGGGGDSEG